MRWVWIAAILFSLVLIPFFLFGEQLERWSPVASPTSGVAIAGLLALDIVLPIPSSIVSTASGAMLGLLGGTLANWIGMTAGCGVGYWIGTCGAARAERFVGPAHLARAQRLMTRWGLGALIVCRAIPVLAEASVVFAGLVRWPFARFMVSTTLANLVIAAAYAYLGSSLKR